MSRVIQRPLFFSRLLLLALLLSTSGLLLTGCTEGKTVRFKINSVPKGAHVLYRVEGGGLPCQGKWVYLGNTPLQGVQQFNEAQVAGADRITLKLMHNGYHDQTKEWDGESFWKEVENKEVVFWTPELSRSVH